jgi:serine protease Do
MNNNYKKPLNGGLMAVLAGALIWGTTCLAFDRSLTGEKVVKVNVPITVNETPLKRDARSGTSYSPVVKQVSPSVVSIFTSKTVKNPRAEQGLDNPLFEQFFGEQFGQGRGGQRQPRSLKQSGLGSGVIVTKDGYILTNNHVVDGADEVKVAREKDRQEYVAKVVGRDPKTDIAVLKIEASDLPAITFGDSDLMEVGDVVLAVGNPFGIGQTVTMGIVSATDRGNMGIEDYENFIQTDAAINPGNSGGALVDAEGRLIGINTAIMSRSGGNMGVGFAIPANQARHIMEELIKDGRVSRGLLGVTIQDVNAQLAKQFKLPKTEGALVGDVAEKSAAAEAGLKSGDVITAFNGKPVADSRNLKLMVGRTAPGVKVEVKALRDGKEKTFKVTLKEMTDPKVAKAGKDADKDDSDALNGVAVGDIDSSMRAKYKLPAGVKGAVITGVDPDSSSYQAGLREGDVIQEINRKAVTTADEAVEASKHIEQKQVLLRVWSRGSGRFVIVDESKAS